MRRVLTETGWSAAEWAARAGVHPAALSRTIKHDAPLGRTVATELARAVAEAHYRDRIKVTPIQREDLCPKLARRPAA